MRELGGVRTALEYGGTGAVLVRRFKFDRRLDALAVLIEPLVERVRELPIDGIIPVPRHPGRVRELGCDPVFELARRLARRCGRPLWDGALMRNRQTAPQTGLDPRARRQNIAGSFSTQAAERLNRRILLLDDVTTTGATLREAELALRSGGKPKAVIPVALAGTPPAAWTNPCPVRYNGNDSQVAGGPPVADSVKLTSDLTLGHQANLGEEVSNSDFSAGTEMTVLEEFENAWLVKSDDGQLFNVRKDQAQPA
ncbi:MAG: ComF family protein [bacterium]|nr:ComF family protein [bacterium]